MAIKLPRYSNNSAKVPQIKIASQNPSGGSGSALTQVGQTLMKSVEAYANQKNQIENDLRAIDFQNTVNTAKATAEGNIAMLADSYKDNNNWGTAAGKDDGNGNITGGWEKGYQDKILAQRKQFKKDLNEPQFAALEASLTQLELAGQLNVIQQVRGAKVKYATHIFNQQMKTFSQRLDLAETRTAILSAYSDLTIGSPSNPAVFQEEIKNNAGKVVQPASMTGRVIGPVAYSEAQTKVKSAVTQKLLLIDALNSNQDGMQGDTGFTVTDPSGDEVTNWKKALSALEDGQNEFVNADGVILTVDDAERKAAIVNARAEYKVQLDMFKIESFQLGNDEHNEIQVELIALGFGKKKNDTFKTQDKTLSVRSMAFIKNRIANSENMTSGQKKDLYTMLTNLETKQKAAAAAAAKGGIETWETPQAIKFQQIANVMIFSGQVKNRQMARFLDVGFSNGLMDIAGYQKLQDKMTSILKVDDSYEQELIATARTTIEKTLRIDSGAMDRLMGGLQGMAVGSNVSDITKLLEKSSVREGIAFAASNNLLLAVKKGQDKGFSIENMLVNANSPNYIVNDIINRYKEAVDRSGADNAARKIAKLAVDAFEANPTFKFVFNDWVVGKAPVLNNQNYTRLANETIGEWIERTAKLTGVSVLPDSLTNQDNQSTVNVVIP